MMKRLAVLISILFFFGMGSSFAGINDGLVAYYPFNGDANDESGNGNNGTLQNGVALASGIFGEALSFDGSDDFVNIGNLTSFAFENSEAFSICAWINIDDTTTQKTIFAKALTVSPFTGYIFKVNNSVLTVLLQSNAVNDIGFNGVTSLTPGRWYYAVLTYDGSSTLAGAKIYLDGVEEGKNVIADGSPLGSLLNGGNVAIGARVDTNTIELMNGKIDEVKVYDRMLTAAEIQDLYYNRSANYDYVSIDPEGATLTYAQDINDNGLIVGNYRVGSTGGNFLLSNGVYTTDIPGLPSSGVGAYGVNNHGDIVGSYEDGKSHAFILKSGTFTTYDYPKISVVDTTGEGINDSGEITGWYIDSAPTGEFGYVYSAGSYASFGFPGSSYTNPLGMNNSGHVVGGYFSSIDNLSHGFFYDGTITTIDYPGSTFTHAYDINDSGHIIGSYMFADQINHGFLYDGNSFVTIDFPGAIHTRCYGNNNHGQIVGYYTDTAGVHHGFLATPVLANQAPILSPIGNKGGQEGQLLEFQITATDPDINDTLTFRAIQLDPQGIEIDLPDGATFTQIDNNNALFSWTPNFSQSGNYDIMFEVKDSGNPMELNFDVVTICIGNVNRAPIFTLVGPQTVDEGSLLEFTVEAIDPDGDNVILSSGHPAFDPATGLFSWTPDYLDEGTRTVTFTATDDGDPVESSEMGVPITVGNMPNPTQLTDDLIGDIENSGLPHNVINSYMANLKKVNKFIEKGKIEPAANQIFAFMCKIEEDLAQGEIGQATADNYLFRATEIIQDLGVDPTSRVCE